MKRGLETNLTRAVRAMPSLRHSIPGEPFSFDKSEVMQWLLRQPAVLQKVFEVAKDSGAMAYDSATGRWAGVPAKPEAPKS